MQIIYNPFTRPEVEGSSWTLRELWARISDPKLGFEFGLKYFELQLKFRDQPDSDPCERECRGQIVRNGVLGTRAGSAAGSHRGDH
jgi:hypothetical protein